MLHDPVCALNIWTSKLAESPYLGAQGVRFPPTPNIESSDGDLASECEPQKRNSGLELSTSFDRVG